MEEKPRKGNITAKIFVFFTKPETNANRHHFSRKNLTLCQPD